MVQRTQTQYETFNQDIEMSRLTLSRHLQKECDKNRRFLRSNAPCLLVTEGVVINCVYECDSNIDFASNKSTVVSEKRGNISFSCIYECEYNSILMQRKDVILEWIFLPHKPNKKLKTYIEKISDLIHKDNPDTSLMAYVGKVFTPSLVSLESVENHKSFSTRYEKPSFDLSAKIVQETPKMY
ncbi:hypothetical protein STEG23_014350 [Scotinomys teguina]